MFLLKWQRTQVSFFPPPSSSGRLPGRKKKRNKDKEPLSPRRRTAARHPFPWGGRRAHREAGKTRRKGRRGLSLTPGLGLFLLLFRPVPERQRAQTAIGKGPGPFHIRPCLPEGPYKKTGNVGVPGFCKRPRHPGGKRRGRAASMTSYIFRLGKASALCRVKEPVRKALVAVTRC